MQLSTSFRINSPQVVHETIDDEVVIINLDNGNYYSLQGVGAKIWSSMEGGAAIQHMVVEIGQRYQGGGAQIETGVTESIAELQREGLICPEAAESGQERLLQTGTGPETQKLRFEMPVLEKHDDMQDLLLLDPIHEVDESGWPSQESNSTR